MLPTTSRKRRTTDLTSRRLWIKGNIAIRGV
jgi:hypothetical protein